MPHAELKYAPDLDLDTGLILAEIEAVLQKHDPDSGDCKGRAYPATAAHHAHVIAEISLLPKAHRDKAFMDALRRDLFDAIGSKLPRPVWFSLNVSFSPEGYMTEKLT